MTLPRLDVPDAVRRIVAAMHPVGTERLPLGEALHRTFAAPIHAPFSLPPWTNASMDGYALHAADLRGARPDAPRRVRVIGISRPGGDAVQVPGPGEAIRVYTGGMVPDGIDTVIRQEDTSRDGDTLILHGDRDAGANIRQRGGDLMQGTCVAEAGEPLTPGRLALLAALGITIVAVRRRPVVGVLVSGDELAGPDQRATIQEGTRLADVNTPMLCALIADAGGVPLPLGIAPDDPATIRRMIADAPPMDLLLTAGGVSVGDHDHLPAVMTSLGAETVFRRVRLRPGGPTVFAIRSPGAPWLGLPGNPVSAFVTFELFARAAIAALRGANAPVRRGVAVTLLDAVPRDRVLDLYLRVCLEEPGESGLPGARVTGRQGSGILSSIASADALLLVEAGEDDAPAGGTYRALPCPGIWGGYLSG